ncbi:MAG: methyltransferase domain-containing protein [Candidatus Coatesbacteria bacterium]
MSVFAGLLRCPRCGSADLDEGSSFACPACAATYEVAAGFPVLTLPGPGATRTRIAAYYDAAAPGYEASHGIGHPGGAWSIREKYVPFLARHLGPRDTVLEIGAGTGKLTVELRRMAGRVIASDIAPGMLRWAREHGRLEAGVVADAERLPFRDGVFDAVVAMNALSYCVDKDAALGETRRVLKPGGRLLLIDMNYLLHFPYLLLGLREWRKARLWTGQLLESTPWGWNRRIRAAGFRITEAFEFNWVPHRFEETAVRRWMAPADRLLSRIPLVRRCAMRIGIAAVAP